MLLQKAVEYTINNAQTGKKKDGEAETPIVDKRKSDHFDRKQVKNAT